MSTSQVQNLYQGVYPFFLRDSVGNYEIMQTPTQRERKKQRETERKREQAKSSESERDAESEKDREIRYGMMGVQTICRTYWMIPVWPQSILLRVMCFSIASRTLFMRCTNEGGGSGGVPARRGTTPCSPLTDSFSTREVYGRLWWWMIDSSSARTTTPAKSATSCQ